jgi:hypothetical protein
LASRIYNDVERTQKDVLFGVLFYIALFVPFSYCLERLLFSFVDIHKRIVAFLVILGLVIGLIYLVHPAFQLTYSPLVVILAFFILSLSVIVALIIMGRFEQEMVLLQQRARHQKGSEISRTKAFAAAFVLGVSNLRRRPIRTVLTCVTLIILTFTIMSFTSVKSMRHRGRLRLKEQSPYQGLLLKILNWDSLPPEALDTVENKFQGQAGGSGAKGMAGSQRSHQGDGGSHPSGWEGSSGKGGSGLKLSGAPGESAWGYPKLRTLVSEGRAAGGTSVG